MKSPLSFTWPAEDRDFACRARLQEASGRVRFPFSERRAAKATKRMFSIARKYRKRITRLYVYQWSIDFSGNRFDAGLVRADGAPRPAYYVVRHHRRWIR